MHVSELRHLAGVLVRMMDRVAVSERSVRRLLEDGMDPLRSRLARS
ncbi:MAG: hypothetical protein HY721_11775 [Planctomycetes bacterium]|nr:hypothetical protein [Planctomycetota bacterium]